ncbi:MAG: hypothetical protein IPM82_21455 [Saprospiraceae bacterium]|nr:hypothetical protein [Saprospiraceae bacterium]
MCAIFVSINFMVKRILAYHLVFLVLLTNIGLPVFTHVCNGQGKEWSSVLLPVRSCCSKKAEATKSCNSPKSGHCKKGIKSKPCCENHTSLVQLNGSFLANFQTWSVKKLDIALPVFALANQAIVFPFSTSTFSSFQPHAPPVQLHGRSLLIFEQVFRC